MNLVDRAHALMVEYDYRWNINGSLRVPTKDELGRGIERLKNHLEKNGGDSAQMGRFIVTKTGNPPIYDIFIHLGEA